MNFFCIKAADLPAFIKPVGPHEEIRPVPQVGKDGKPTGKFILQADIGLAGAAYAREAAKPYYAAKATIIDVKETTKP